MKKTITPKQTYTMKSEACKGLWFSHFTFTATSQEDANNKAFKWARYQGKDVREVKAEASTEDEKVWQTHNEYIS